MNYYMNKNLNLKNQLLTYKKCTTLINIVKIQIILTSLHKTLTSISG